MTCKERLAIEHPEHFNPNLWAGVDTCPTAFGYLKQPDYCNDESMSCNERCVKCWDREIPESTPEIDFDYEAEDMPGEPLRYGHIGKPLAKVKDIFEENGGIEVVLDDVSEEAKKLLTEPHIKDSGDRTQFESGAVRDMREGKGRCDLMPLEVVSNALSDPTILELKLFLNTRNTFHLYTCLNQFASVYDDGKTKASEKEIVTQRRCSMFLEVAKHFEEGAKKYGENNWQKGIPVHCYIDSAVRHYLKWLRGDKDEPHDRAFVWNLMCCIWEVDYSPRAKEKTDA